MLPFSQFTVKHFIPKTPFSIHILKTLPCFNAAYFLYNTVLFMTILHCLVSLFYTNRHVNNTNTGVAESLASLHPKRVGLILVDQNDLL